jgi:hypothetical protein
MNARTLITVAATIVAALAVGAAPASSTIQPLRAVLDGGNIASDVCGTATYTGVASLTSDLNVGQFALDVSGLTWLLGEELAVYVAGYRIGEMRVDEDGHASLRVRSNERQTWPPIELGTPIDVRHQEALVAGGFLDEMPGPGCE